jgi:hypothetical protein
MQHSIKFIGNQREELSLMRKEKNPFNAEDFFNFAKSNNKKYSIIENGTDLLVSTWYSGDLIDDYNKTR